MYFLYIYHLSRRGYLSLLVIFQSLFVEFCVCSGCYILWWRWLIALSHFFTIYIVLYTCVVCMLSINSKDLHFMKRYVYRLSQQTWATLVKIDNFQSIFVDSIAVWLGCIKLFDLITAHKLCFIYISSSKNNYYLLIVVIIWYLYNN